MQAEKFNSIVELLDFLPDDEKEIVLVLREVIKETAPELKEKLSYNVPFYFGNKRVMYIWPGSVAWGKHTKSGVQIGFTKAYLMDDHSNFLEKGNRKQVYTKTFYNIDELEHSFETLVVLIREALNIDQNSILK